MITEIRNKMWNNLHKIKNKVEDKLNQIEDRLIDKMLGEQLKHNAPMPLITMKKIQDNTTELYNNLYGNENEESQVAGDNDVGTSEEASK